MQSAEWAVETYNEENKTNLELVDIHEAQYCLNRLGIHQRFLISTINHNRNGPNQEYYVLIRIAPLRFIHLLCFEPYSACTDEL